MSNSIVQTKNITQSGSLPFETVEVTYNNTHQDAGRLSSDLKEITALYNIGVALNSSLNPKEVLWALYKETSRLIDTSNFALAIYDQQHKALIFILIFDQGQRIKPVSIKVSNQSGLTGTVFTSQSSLLVQDFTHSNKKFEIKQLNPNKQIHSWLGVPIINPGQSGKSAQGAIMVWSYEADAYNDHHVWLLSAIGTQASIAIRNARLFESSQRRAEKMAQLRDTAQRKADEMAFINDVARILSASLKLDTILTKIMEQVDDMLAVEAGSLLLTDPANGDLVFQIALGDKASQVKPFRIPKGQGIAGKVAETGEALVVTDVGLDQRHFKAVDKKIQFITRNMVCVPLVLHEQVIGVLEVMNKKVGDFTQSDVELLISIASYAAIAIENARLYQSLEAEHTRTIAVEQDARKKLASDLHDGPTQLVAAIMMSLDFATQALEKDPSLIPKTIVEMQELASRASHQMRTLLFELRPLVLEKQGLGAALQVFLGRRQKDQHTKLLLKIETDNLDGDITRRDGKIETTIFAIVQELVNNAIKHAKAANIIVTLKEIPSGIYTSVTDDGAGFDIDAIMRNYETRGSLGMINLRERAEAVGGEFNMVSKIGEGTQATIFIPNERSEKEKRIKKRTVTGMLRLPPNMTPLKSKLE